MKNDPNENNDNDTESTDSENSNSAETSNSSPDGHYEGTESGYVYVTDEHSIRFDY